MKELGLTQQYLLCALNKNGKLSAWSVEQQVCLTGGALLELLDAGCCEEGKEIAAREKSTGEERTTPFLCLSGGETQEKSITIASDYAFSFTDKRIKELVYSVGGSLVKEGCAKEKNGKESWWKACVFIRRRDVWIALSSSSGRNFWRRAR